MKALNKMMKLSFQKSKKHKEYSFDPEDLIPRLTKPGYQTEPPMLTIYRMSEEELANIDEFTIYNQNAKIIWEGKTDIRGLNLDQIVHLMHQSVELYPENDSLPEVGQELNKPARIVFYNWNLPKKYQNEPSKYKRKLAEWSSSINADLEYYDEEKAEVSIKVKHFQLNTNASA